ncbi:MAG TPA: multicopper oxidase domain-containing protein [Rhizomicrobium sp.]|jgi:FtsP/CotA-like multicopper oxidase with cupredoxin domain
MRTIRQNIATAILGFLAFVVAPCCAMAGQGACPRPAQGSVISNPPGLYSQNGVLKVSLGYFTTVDKWGRTLFCYTTPDGLDAPTLHLNPGDVLDLTLTNMEATLINSGRNGGAALAILQSLGSGAETLTDPARACASNTMTVMSVNLHFHGLNVSPRCHADDVIHTVINPGESFEYKFKIPKDEPPGMYWYHQHIHGISSPAVQGGASGAIEIEGIANLQPAVQGLPERYLIVRDQPLANPPAPGQPTLTQVPFWDVSLNYVPISYPKYVPGIIQMQPGAQEFWRVVNASANTILDLQLLYDSKAQPIQIVAFDGVPTGSQDGHHQGTIVTQQDVLIPPAGRVEFIVTGPSASVKRAVLYTRRIDTGPAGDVDTTRPLAKIHLTHNLKKIPKPILATDVRVDGQRFAGVTDAMVTAHRTLYFDEHIGVSKKNPGAGMVFFITVKGEYERYYSPENPPAITTTRGAVEDWTIENHTKEVHEFHIHQIHFQVLAVNGNAIPPDKRQWYDTYQVPYYTGKGPWPSIKVRMDFRGAVVGEFVYHCHILDHEDDGMMANILVLPAVPPPNGHPGNSPTHQASLTGSTNRRLGRLRTRA